MDVVYLSIFDQVQYCYFFSSSPAPICRFLKKWIYYSRGIAIFIIKFVCDFLSHSRISLIWRCHHYRWRASAFDLCLAAWHWGFHTYSVICSSPILRTQCSVQWSSLSVISRRLRIRERNGCCKCKILTMRRLDKSLALRLYRVIYDSHAGNLQTCALVWSVRAHSRKDEVHVHCHCAVTSSYTGHSSCPSQK